jgi:hypothetical protein
MTSHPVSAKALAHSDHLRRLCAPPGCLAARACLCISEDRRVVVRVTSDLPWMRFGPVGRYEHGCPLNRAASS